MASLEDVAATKAAPKDRTLQEAGLRPILAALEQPVAILAAWLLLSALEESVQVLSMALGDRVMVGSVSAAQVAALVEPVKILAGEVVPPATMLAPHFPRPAALVAVASFVLQDQPTYQPTVSSISPTSGPTAGGQAVTISGANFVSANAVNIGGAPVTGFSVPNTTTITGTTSAGGAGTHNVNVGVSSGPPAGIGASLYTYVAPPSVSSCSPAFGLTNVATLVIITGANMDGVNAVLFGGTPVTLGIAVSNSTTVYAWAPPHTAGLVNVVVSNSYGTGTGTNLFNYVLPASGFNMPGMGV